MPNVKSGDWVKPMEGESIGFVRRVARDGSWADVDWRTHTKRMGAKFLRVQTTIPIGNGMEMTDLTREAELEKGE